MRYAVQVDNNTPASSLRSTVIGGFRFALQFTPGASFEGGSTQAVGQITNLQPPGWIDFFQLWGWAKDSSRQWDARFFWQGNEVQEIGPQTITQGQSVQYTLTAPNLDPESLNRFRADLYAWDKSGKKGQLGARLGHLGLTIPVAPDEVAPTWFAGSTPDAQHPYVTAPQAVFAQVQDSLGLMNPSGFSAHLSGVLTSGAAYSQDVTQHLQYVASPDQLYTVSGNLSAPPMMPLADGYYTLALHAQDMAGNSAQPDPLQSQFRIDTTPPVISLTSNAGPALCTAQGTSNLTASVTDWSPITTNINLNGALALQQAASPSSATTQVTQSIPIQLPLVAGNNLFSVTSSDVEGNTVTSPATFQLFYDPQAPAISLSQSDGQYTRQPNFTLVVTVTDPGTLLTTAYQNGVQIAQSTQASFTINVTLAALNNTFEIDSVNCAGTKSVAKLNQIFFEPAAPTISLSQTGTACTTQPNSNFTATATSFSPVTTSVVENGKNAIQAQASPASLGSLLTQNIPVQLPLIVGANVFSASTQDATGSSAQAPAGLTITYLPQGPAITLGQADNQIVSDKNFQFSVSTSSPGSFLTTVLENGAQITQSTQSNFTVNATLAELGNTFEVDSVDCAGNKTVAKLGSIFLDSVPPSITLGVSGPILTRTAAFEIPATIQSETAELATVTQNGTQIYQSGAPAFTVQATLVEGLNVFVITSTNVANITSSVTLANVVLDTTAPVLSSLSPQDGATLTSLSFPVSFSSSEPLSQASANMLGLTLSSDGKSASGVFTAQNSGSLPLTFQATDLAGNVSTISETVNISLSALNGNLISVVPETDGVHLDIVGAPGAATPGIAVSAAASFFNTGSTTSAADGSFKIAMETFQSATVTATSPATGKTSTVNVTWGSGSTMLSGIVEDTSGNPLAGATMTLPGTTVPSVQTQADGTYRFQQPVTGRQKLIVDGTTIPVTNSSGISRSFSKTSVIVNIGLFQNNVQRPIYLQPTLLDGSAPTIQASMGGTVTNVNAPGATLAIAAGSVSFPAGSAQTLPGGDTQAPISMTQISSQFATVPPMAFAVPTHVVALEPSGTTFSQPATLTLPNDNSLPAGTQMVAMSMNSMTGRWELDGIAAVDAGEQTVTTLPGHGITHFSIVYFTPTFGPPVEVLGTNSPSTDSFGGTLSKSVELPSYAILGQSFTPKLLYNSSWAKPNAFVSNLFDLTPYQVSQGNLQDGVADYTTQSCFLFICSPEQAQAFWYASIQEVAWYQPNLITAQFTSGSIQSPVMNFAGDPANPLNPINSANPLLPARTVVSYGMNLQDPTTKAYFPSGVYPYSAKYTMQLDELTLGTQTLPTWNPNNQDFDEVQSSLNSDTQLQQVFPNDLTGTLIVENETQSSAGLGWKVAGVQKIANPTESRILIEEGDGSESTFVINNVINTLLESPTVQCFGFRGRTSSTVCSPNSITFYQDALGTTDLSRWPFAIFSQQNPAVMTSTSGTITTETVTNIVTSAVLQRYDLTQGVDSDPVQTYQSPPGKLGGLLSLPGGQIYESSLDESAIVSAGTAGFGFVAVGNSAGFNGDGPITDNTELNSPMTIIAGPRVNTLVFADYGNNRVRLIDLTANTIQTIAGNGNFLAADIGDGGPAVNASVSHPMGLAYDSTGNLYISTGNNVIRKVDTANNISTFAGSPNGFLEDSGPASRALFSAPKGLVVDNIHGYLYIADSGQNRVVRVDFATLTAKTVAGNGTPGDSEDGDVALGAVLSSPASLGLDSNQNLIIADAGNHSIKQVIFANTTSPILTFNSTTAATQGARQNPDGSWVPFVQKNSDNTWTRNYRNGASILFNAQGLETDAFDPIGNHTAFGYDGNGNLTSMTDPTNRVLTFNYVGGLLNTVTDPAGRTTQLNYGAGNTLTTVTFPDSTTKAFGYDGTGLLTTDQDQRGFTTTYSYNQYDRLTTVQLANGANLGVNDAGSQTALNNATGDTAAVAMPYGTDIGSTAANTVTDANGNTTIVSKNYYGFVESIVDPLGNKTTMLTDEFGHPTQTTQPDGSIVTLTYNSWFDVVSQNNSSTGITTSQAFDAFGTLLSSKDGRGLTTTYAYNTQRQIQTKTDAMNHVTTYAYNSFGEPTTVTNYLNQSTQNGYDSAGNLTTVTDALGQVTTYSFDLAGNVTQLKDAKGNATLYAYDIFNRLTSVTTPKGELTKYVYLATGQLSTVTDPLDNVTTYVIDALGRVTSKTDQSGFVTQNTYDNNGNATQIIDPNGNVKKLSYDALNHLTQEILPDNTIGLVYDFRGNVTSVTDNNSTVGASFDGSGRLTSSTWRGLGAAAVIPSNNLSYQLDGNGNLTQVLDDTGATNLSYDFSNRLTSLTNPLNEVYTYSYNDSNGSVTFNRPGSTSTYNFDVTNLISSITHTAHGTTLSSYSLTRDSVGNLTQVATNVATRALAYDADYQVSSATNPETANAAMKSETFGYDKISNRTTDQAGVYTYDVKSQRLAQDYRYFYFYDNNGNLTSKQAIGLTGEVINYSYSSQNQLIKIRSYMPVAGSYDPSTLWIPNSTLVQEVDYVYDALGRRVQKQVVNYNNASLSFTRRYGYDGLNILFEYNGNNDLLARYTHSLSAGDDVLAVNVSQAGVSAGLAQTAGSYEYIKDMLGSVVDVADTSGNKIQHFIYSAFGELLGIQNALAADVTASPPLATTYGFTGRELDPESGLMYYRARYYDPNIGRFLQKDPNPGKLNLPASVNNSYIYALNNPANRVDPSGQFSWFEDLLIGIAAAVVAVVAVVLAPFSLGGSAVLGGIVEGALIGALVGGAVGIGINAYVGRPWDDQIGVAIGIGAIAGGIAGGITAAITGGASAGSTASSAASDSGTGPVQIGQQQLAQLSNLKIVIPVACSTGLKGGIALGVIGGLTMRSGNPIGIIVGGLTVVAGAYWALSACAVIPF